MRTMLCILEAWSPHLQLIDVTIHPRFDESSIVDTLSHLLFLFTFSGLGLYYAHTVAIGHGSSFDRSI